MSLFIVRNRESTKGKMDELGHRRDTVQCLTPTRDTSDTYSNTTVPAWVRKYLFHVISTSKVGLQSHWGWEQLHAFGFTCLQVKRHTFTNAASCLQHKMIKSWLSSILSLYLWVNFECIWMSFSNFSPNSIHSHIGLFCAIGIWTPHCWM